MAHARSGVAGLDAKAEGTSLSESGQGLWSCAWLALCFGIGILTSSIDNTSKAAAIHLTKTQASTLGPVGSAHRHVTDCC